MYLLDSTHVWHVAKTGNDGNGGHAQQYPIALAADTKLTISAAVTAAASGDTIIIWPGTYVENVDLDAAGKGLILVGTHRDTCIISPADDNAVEIESNCQLHNLSLIAGGSANKGVNGTSKNNIVIDNCYCFGNYDGILLSGKNIRVTNAYCKANYDGANFGSAEGLFIENCIFETDGGVTISDVYGLRLDSRLFDELGVIVRNSLILNVRIADSTQCAVGFYITKGSAILENCQIVAVTKTSATGDATAVKCGTGPILCGNMVLKNCTLYSSSNGGTALDIYVDNTGGEVNVLNCLYDRTKVSEVDGGKLLDLSDADGRVNVSQIEGVDATNQIRDSVVDDATRIDASALNTLSGHDPGATLVKVADVPTAAAIQAELEENGASLLDTLADRLTTARAGYLDELAAANIPGDIDAIKGYIDTEIAAILAAVDTEIGDIKTAVDTYLDAAISSRSSHTAAQAGTDAASKVLVTPAQKIVTNASGQVEADTKKVEGQTLSSKVGDNLNTFFQNAGEDTTKTVDEVGGQSSAAIVKAAKVILNKKVQNKQTKVVQYYDDDDETVIHTQTPVDNDETFEVNPS